MPFKNCYGLLLQSTDGQELAVLMFVILDREAYVLCSNSTSASSVS